MVEGFICQLDFYRHTHASDEEDDAEQWGSHNAINAVVFARRCCRLIGALLVVVGDVEVPQLVNAADMHTRRRRRMGGGQLVIRCCGRSVAFI